MKKLIIKSGYTLDELRSPSRKQNLVVVRWLLFEHLRAKGLLHQQIGEVFNRKRVAVRHGLIALVEMKEDTLVKAWREKLGLP